MTQKGLFTNISFSSGWGAHVWSYWWQMTLPCSVSRRSRMVWMRTVGPGKGIHQTLHDHQTGFEVWDPKV